MVDSPYRVPSVARDADFYSPNWVKYGQEIDRKSDKSDRKRQSVLYLSPISSSLCLTVIPEFRDSRLASHVAAVRWFLLEVDERHGVLSLLQ